MRKIGLSCKISLSHTLPISLSHVISLNQSDLPLSHRLQNLAREADLAREANLAREASASFGRSASVREADLSIDLAKLTDRSDVP